jgi:hypothetical protein
MPKFPAIPWSDLFNPVLVKEARQLTRSKLLLAVIWIELFGLALFTSVTLIWHLWDVEASDAGLSFFLTQIQILAAAMACGALDAMLRTLAERSETTTDLMYVSLLSPARLLQGKFWAGLSVNLLILSLGLPFLALSYLLRGISLPTLAWGSFYLLVLAVMLMPLAQVIALMPVPMLMKKYGAGFCLVAGVVWLGFSVRKILELIASGMGWVEFCLWMVLLAGLFLLLHSTARFLLMRPVTDRSWRPRSLMLGVALAWMAVTIGCIVLAGGSRIVSVYGYFALFEKSPIIAAGLSLLHLLPVLAIMLALQCPAVMMTSWRRPRRISAKWFFPLLDGTWNGMAIAAMLAGLAMICVLASLSILLLDLSGLSRIFIYAASAPVFFGYLFCYAMTSRFIADWLRRRGYTAVTALHLFSIMLFVAGLATLVGIAFVEHAPPSKEMHWILVGDVFAFFCQGQCKSGYLLVQAKVMLVWALPLFYWGRLSFLQLQPLHSLPAPALRKSSVLSWRISFSDIGRLWQDWQSDAPARRLLPEWLLRVAACLCPVLVNRIRLPVFGSSWLADANPVLVKEIRQMGRSRFPGIVLWLEIVMLVVAAVLGLAGVFSGQLMRGNESAVLLQILMIPALALLAIGLEQMNRTAKESDSAATDLLFVTTLTPDQIVLGKFGAVLVPMSLILLPASLFLVVSAWIGIISGMVAGFSCLFLFAMGILLAALAVGLALIPAPATIKRYVFSPLLVVSGISLVLAAGQEICYYNSESGINLLNGGLDMASWLLLLGLSVTVLLALARFLAASPISARSQPLRLRLLMAGLAWVPIGLLFAWRWSWTDDGKEIIMDSTIGFFLLPVIILFAALLCPRPQVVSPTRASGWRRFCRYLFLEGTANGLAMAALLALLSASTIHLWGLAGRGIIGMKYEMESSEIYSSQYPFPACFSMHDNALAIGLSLIGFGYLFCYALSAWLAADWLQRRQTDNPLFKPSLILIIGVAVAALGSCFMLITEKAAGSKLEILLPANLFAWLWPVQHQQWLGWHAAIIFVWLGTCLWLFRRWRQE